MKERYKIIFYSVLLVATVLIGITFSYFTAQISGNEESETITAASGTMKIVYDGGAAITASNISPETEPFATKRFTITGTNSTDKPMPYEIKLIIDANTFSSQTIEVLLNSEDEFPVGDVADNIRKKIDTTDLSLGVGNFNKGTNVVHNYIAYFFFPDNNTNQSVDMNKTFKAHIEVNEKIMLNVNTIASFGTFLGTNPTRVKYGEDVTLSFSSGTYTCSESINYKECDGKYDSLTSNGFNITLTNVKSDISCKIEVCPAD